LNAKKVAEFISGWLKDYAGKANSKGYIIGISGGIDSAVTSLLCAQTGLKVLCLEMAIHQNPNEVNRGLEHIAWLEKNSPMFLTYASISPKHLTRFVNLCLKFLLHTVCPWPIPAHVCA
jgi:PP-loop superfamily ATP-utilizing enzyme